MISRMVLAGFSMLLFLSQALFADEPLTPSPGRLFNVSYIGNNFTITTNTGFFYKVAGIKSFTPGFSFSNCNPDPNGHCLFGVGNTLPASPVMAGPAVQPALKLCLNATGDTFSCEKFFMGDRFAYVANVNNGNGSISLCPINSASGVFGTCIDSGATTLTPNPGSIVVNPAGTLAYVGNFSNTTTITICPINTDGTLGSCTDQDGNGTFHYANIFLNNAGTLAYAANYSDSTVSVCPINADGLFGTCTTTGNGFNNPQGIALNNAGTIAYVTNFNGPNVSMCPINADGSFGTCTYTGNGFDQPAGIVLNKGGAIAYVVNYAFPGTVSMCPINADGSFGTCTYTGNGFSLSAGIVLNKGGTIAYVTNNTMMGTVSMCPINANGSFGTCATTGNGFNQPFGIAVF